MMDAATAILILGGPRAEAMAAAVAAQERAMAERVRKAADAIPADITLRDVRRVLGRLQAGSISPVSGRRSRQAERVLWAADALLTGPVAITGGAWTLAYRIAHVGEASATTIAVAASICDRLISSHGADASVRDLVAPMVEDGDREAKAILQDAIARLAGNRRPLRTLGDAIPGLGAELDIAQQTRIDLAVKPMLSHAVADDFIEVDERAEAERTDHQIGEDAPISDSPHTVADADTHGGDGNSGECDHAASTTTDDRDACASAHAQDAAADTPDGTPCPTCGPDGLSEAPGSTGEDAATSNGAGYQPACRGDNGGDEPTGEMGSHLDGARTVGDKGLAGIQAPAQAGGSDGIEDTCDGHKAEVEQPEPREQAGADAAADDDSAWGGDAGSPADSTDTDGGQHLDADAALSVPYAVREQRAAKDFAASLRRIVEASCAPRGKASHRIDASALMRELVSRRCAMHRARREEADLREVVIVVDESGSCAATVAATYRAAVAVAREVACDRVSVMLHSNGHLVRLADGAPCAPWLRREIDARAKALGRHYYSASQQAASADIWQAIAKRRPGLVIALGDADADWALQGLHDAGVRVVMLSHTAYTSDYEVAAPVLDVISAASAIKQIK